MPRWNRSRRVSAVPKGSMQPRFNELMNKMEGFALIVYFGFKLWTFFLVVQFGVVNLARFMLHIMICYELMTKLRLCMFSAMFHMQTTCFYSSSGLAGGVWAREQNKHQTCSSSLTAIRTLLWQWACLLGINCPSVVPKCKGLTVKMKNPFTV